jgi:enoyl-CoA hydratase/carnithine racemase
VQGKEVDMSEQGLLIERVGQILALTINRERRRNALNDATLHALMAALDDAHKGEIRGIVLRGAGLKAFSSGSDVKELAEQSIDERLAHTALGQRVADAIQQHPCPSVAAIEGYCLGGGLEMAMACDYRIAGNGATLGLPEVLLGALPTWGGTTRLPNLVGQSRASSMIVFGRTIDAATALNWGLVHDVVAEGGAYDTATRFLTDFASKTHGKVVAMAKQLLVFGRGASAAAGLHMEYLADMTALASEAVNQGTSKFADKGRS